MGWEVPLLFPVEGHGDSEILLSVTASYTELHVCNSIHSYNVIYIRFSFQENLEFVSAVTQNWVLSYWKIGYVVEFHYD